ncbi:TetR/AcrR family transcriptional regulator [Conyzicola sp.]|uniref:TetR/AcrR family transcriptional regulator n=1 Tax=Conyzicola sp. TaxID=1969404 RepID=UPI003988ADE9
MTARTSKQDRGIERQRAILDAAVSILLTGRMSAVTHRSVADKAGVPPAAIRYYYSTREDLLSAALDTIESARHFAAQNAASPSGQATIDSTVTRLLHTYLGSTLDDVTIAATIGWIADAPRESDRLAAELAEVWKDIESDVAHTLIACGYSASWAGLCAHIIDGSILAAVAGGRENLANYASAPLHEFLKLAKTNAQD